MGAERSLIVLRCESGHHMEVTMASFNLELRTNTDTNNAFLIFRLKIPAGYHMCPAGIWDGA
jgi:hypothetical protein